MISSYGVIALSKGTGNSESPFDLDFEQSCLFVSMVTAVLHSFIHFMLLFTEEFKMVLSISKQICALINIKYMLLKLYGTLNLSLFVIESVFDFSRSNKSTLLLHCRCLSSPSCKKYFLFYVLRVHFGQTQDKAGFIYQIIIHHREWYILGFFIEYWLLMMQSFYFDSCDVQVMYFQINMNQKLVFSLNFLTPVETIYESNDLENNENCLLYSSVRIVFSPFCS